MSSTNDKAALARMVKYCAAEAEELGLTFVAYCLAVAGGAIAEEVDHQLIDWNEARRLRGLKPNG
ncbi:MAG: hypothetical protein AB7O56_04040 [Bauldia sp.]